MNQLRNEMYLVASEDNPVLASLIAVLDEYKLPAHAEVAPNDWWESFQRFYTSGLVGEHFFQSTDPRKTFFLGRKPQLRSIQEALLRLNTVRAMRDADKESLMSDRKDLISPFESSPFENGKSLERADQPRGHVNGLSARPRTELGSLQDVRNGGAIAAFEPQRQPMVQRFERPPSAFETPPTQGLACYDEAPARNQSTSEMVDVVCRACGQVMTLLEQGDGSDDISAEDLPGGKFSLIELMMHGRCGCSKQTEVHLFVSQPFSRNGHR